VEALQYSDLAKLIDEKVLNEQRGLSRSFDAIPLLR
jgi:predicted transcriptional regulator